MENSTIAAISTPAGSGGVGIIKISGPDAATIALSVFKPKLAASNIDSRFIPVPRYLYYGHVTDPDTSKVIDEVLFVFMRSPHSYTAEDVVEIQSHAGPLVLKTILELLISKGASIAEPGEFTKRAFLNGRIDLTQAEAVADIIKARSEKAIDIAVAQVTGGLKDEIERIKIILIDLITKVEASIDFPDDVEEDIYQDDLIPFIDNDLIAEIENLISRHQEQNFLREGLKVVIVGGPNVGKSSLMNRLINKDRSIVTDVPGTTRDFIEDSFIANGVPIILTDTAGIHDTDDAVEKIGIKKTWDYINDADLILLTFDAGKKFFQNDLSLFENVRHKKVIVVINKRDLPESEKKFEMPAEWSDVPHISISALLNTGVQDLVALITDIVFGSQLELCHHIVPNLRHAGQLQKALASLRDVKKALLADLSPELIAIDLETALYSLREITGEVVHVDILDNIFDNFCIGK